MGAWGEDYYSSDSACDLSDTVGKALLFDTMTRQAYLRVLQNAKPGRGMSAGQLSEFLKQFQTFDKALNKSPKSKNTSPKSILDMFDNDYDFFQNFQELLQNKKTIKLTAPFTPEDIRQIFQVAVYASFDVRDHGFILNETLTPHGVIQNPEVMTQDFIAPEGEKFKYKKARTYEPDLSFYGLGMVMAHLPSEAGHEVFTPYFFKQFLNASSLYFSTPEISTWSDAKSRFSHLSSELQQVVAMACKSPEHQAVLLAHYKTVLNQEATPEVRMTEANFRGEKQKIQVESKAYDMPIIKALLEKQMLSQNIKSCADMKQKKTNSQESQATFKI